MKAPVSIAVLLILGLVFAAAASHPEAAGGAGDPAEPDRHPGHATSWSQPPDDDESGAMSQFAPDSPLYAECADDFIAPEDTEITHVHWWGDWLTTRDAPPIRVARMDGAPAGRADLDCSTAEMRGCNIVILDTNMGAPSNVDVYGCGPWDESGPEVVYMLQIPFDGTSMSATLSDMTADLDIFLLSDCNEDACLHAEDFLLEYWFMEAGTYYLVVDGYDGAVSDYTLTITCAGVPPVYFTIRFYDDLEIGRGRSVPGVLLYETHTMAYHEESGVWPYGQSYWSDIEPFPIVKDEQYWISVQCVSPEVARANWWYWATNSEFSLNSAVMDYEAAEIDRWTSLEEVEGVPLDLAFEISDIDTPVEATSWGVIKSLYR
jgi:hypothetical protein